MRSCALVAAILVQSLAADPALASDFDGSRVLICAPVQAFDCTAGEDCGKGLPEEIGAPAFMRIDLPNKAVIGPKRTSPILLADKSEAQLILQGTEFGYGWVIAVDQETGKMTATLANRENVFVLFGACTAH
ncbi:MAG TPA: hypothetical protein VHF87_17860 [Methylomirabilota bacterium]|jgi:hypothetical protein|nr:hypothetical protein [Methylomirabilota bacterium]